MRLLGYLKWGTVGLLILCSLGIGAVFAKDSDPSRAGGYHIGRIALSPQGEGFLLTVEGSAAPTYTMYELFDPLRVVIDIAGASLAAGFSQPSGLPLGPVQSVTARVLEGQQPAVVRIEAVLADDPAYTVERQGNNVVVSFSGGEARVGEAGKAKRPAAPASKRVGAKGNILRDIEVDTGDLEKTLVRLRTGGAVSGYKEVRLDGSGKTPARMYLDLPGLSLPQGLFRREVGGALARVRASQRPDGVRVVFDSGLPELFTYLVEAQSDGLLVTIAGSGAAPAGDGVADLLTKKSWPKETQDPLLLSAAAALTERIVPKIPPLKPRQPAAAKAPQAKSVAPAPTKKASGTPHDSLGFAGYTKQKITVDFFKIDLHNVFRLFGEISGQNIVVDESINGTVTLALNEVPWDFALDIVLNLKDLQKEERFNTIVISPKAKQFVWPKAAMDNIAVKSDGSVEKLEAISVTERGNSPKELVKARKLIFEAGELDRQGKYAKALLLYESAYALWPENAELADRLAAICLVHLGMNAKAVFYAKASLNHDPARAVAALRAAIGLANMKKVDSAKEYFDRAIAGDLPASEIWQSYAAFAEEYESYRGALALLERHEILYGDTLDTLVARARIFDKMGDTARAVEAYNTVLLSGYEVPDDLKRYITGRIAAAN